MKTTRAMLVVGVLMLVLAVIVAQGLRPKDTTTVAGPVVSGTVSRAPSALPPAIPGAPGASAPASSSSVGSAVPGAPGGVLVPLDAGTLKMDSTTPATRLAPVSPAEPVVRDASAAVNGRTSPPADVVAEQKPVSAPAAGTAAPATPPEKKVVPKTPEKLVVTTSAPKTLFAGQKAISRTRLEIGPSTATFRLTGVSALKGKAFALKEPDRLVVDLDGSWGIDLERTPGNHLIKSVRAGSQEANTRLVFDLLKAPKAFKLVQVDPKTLELQIR